MNRYQGAGAATIVVLLLVLLATHRPGTPSREAGASPTTPEGQKALTPASDSTAISKIGIHKRGQIGSNRQSIPKSTKNASNAGSNKKEAPLVSIQAKTANGKPAADITLGLYHRRTLRTLGNTDSTGELRTAKSDIIGSGIVPLSEEYAKRIYELPTIIGDAFEITLQPSSTIRGNIRLPDGQNPGSDIKVYATRISRETSGASRVWQHTEALASAMTDDHGKFEIRGLIEGAPYSICAGGAGVATNKKAFAVAGTPGEVELNAKYVFGAVLELLDENGNLLRNIHCETGETKIEHIIWAGGNWVLPASRMSALAGLSVEAAFASNPRTVLFWSDSRDATTHSAPAKLSATYLGYWPVNLDIQLGWIAEEVPIYQAIAQAREAGFGSLRVALSTAPEFHSGYRPPEASAPEASLSLFRVDGQYSGEVSQFPLRGLLSGECTVEGIPHGEYLASVTFTVGEYRYPPHGDPGLTVFVGPETSEILLDTEGMGSVEVFLTTLDGQPYRGPAVFLVGEGPTSSARPKDTPADQPVAGFTLSSSRGPARFECAPYLFTGLTPLECQFLPESPRPLDLDQQGISAYTVVLAPGEAATLSIRVDAGY